MKLFVGLFLAGISTTIFANDMVTINKPIVCGETEKILSMIVTEFQERIIFTGPSPTENSVYMVLMNQKTRTWTIVQGNKKAVCILGVGEDGKVNVGPVVQTYHAF